MKKIIISVFLLFCANSFALTPSQEKAKTSLLGKYKKSCIIVDEKDSNVFKKGIDLILHENHTPQCWGGKGDPNVSPVFLRVSIDRFGRVFEYDIISDTFKLKTNFETIMDISNWKHQTKTIFNHYGIKLNRVELYSDKTFAYFYVNSHSLLSDKNKARELFKQLLKANGQWDFIIVDSNGKFYFVEGKKRKLNLK